MIIETQGIIISLVFSLIALISSFLPRKLTMQEGCELKSLKELYFENRQYQVNLKRMQNVLDNMTSRNGMHFKSYSERIEFEKVIHNYFDEFYALKTLSPEELKQFYMDKYERKLEVKND